jgi:hypothetical protein
MLKLTIREINCTCITRDVGHTIHFTTPDLQKYFVKQYSDDGEEYFVLYRKTASSAEKVASKFGMMPPVKYMFGKKVYRQALTKQWLMSLARVGFITVLDDDRKEAGLEYLTEHLQIPEMVAYMGIRFTKPSPCIGCHERLECPFSDEGFRIDDCWYRFNHKENSDD